MEEYIVHLKTTELKELVKDVVKTEVSTQLEKFVAGETYGETVTIEQACKYTGKSRQWINDQFSNGKLTREKIGRNVRINFEQLKGLIKAI